MRRAATARRAITGTPADDVLALQRAAGNRAVAQLLRRDRPPIQRKAAYLSAVDGKYANLVDETAALGPGKDFTATTRKKILETNHIAGVMHHRFESIQQAFQLAGFSELSGLAVAPLRDFKSDVSEIDHIYPKEKSGANSARNAQVLAGDENNRKSKTYPWGEQPHYSGARLLVTEAVAKWPTLKVGDVFSITGAGPGATVDFSPRLPGVPGAAAVSIGAARADDLAPAIDPH